MVSTGNGVVQGEQETPPVRMKRRGLIAGAAALVVGMIAKQSEQVAAANGEAILVGGTYTASSPTSLLGGTAFGGANATLRVSNVIGVGNTYSGIVDSTNDAVQGLVQVMTPPGGLAAAGVLGRNDELNGNGVVGVASNGVGVVGQSTGGSGVSALSTSGAGVFASTGSGTGVVGNSGSATGVAGFSAGGGNGVYGQSVSGIALYGLSTAGPYGVIGQANAANSIALLGITNGDGAIAFSGGTNNPNAFAAVFTGKTVINGNFIVAPGFTKSAAVPHPDGSTRLVYCVEAPESWLEDFGEGKIVGGRAEIALDADFAAVADTSTMHVFLNEVGGHSGLHVSRKTGAKFTVESSPTLARAGGLSVDRISSTFSYRVVARRKDVPPGRLARVSLPSAKLPNIASPKVAIPAAPRRREEKG